MSSTINSIDIENAIKTFTDPYLNTDLVTAGAIKEIIIDNNRVDIDIVLGFPIKTYKGTLQKKLRAVLEQPFPNTEFNIQISSKIIRHAVQSSNSPMPGVSNIIAIASGKGGVGKSTTTVNLALALAQEGARVGILDADIYGPSQPRMLGITGKPETKDGESIQPMSNHGVQVMSMGFLVDEEAPMIWRGPMATQALDQLLFATRWEDLDYLLIDMPPGTGDIHLSLTQKIPVSGAVIVTTPQDIALLDARRGLKMFEKVNVPILGIVENMATHICNQCGHEEHIFGKDGGANMAAQYNVSLLGSLPLDIHIRAESDNGTPPVVSNPDGEIAKKYIEISRRISAKLAMQGKDYSASFPKIVIE